MKFVNMTASAFRDMVKKENKYHAKKTVLDGVKFDSKKESKDWLQLKALESLGIISNLQRQVVFELQPAYVNNQGNKVRAIQYIADFVYKKDGKMYVVDTKSPATRTPVYKIKKKLFEAKFKDYIFVEI